MFHGTSEENLSASEVIRLWNVILTARAVNSIYDALKWKSPKQQSARRIHQWTWTFFRCFHGYIVFFLRSTQLPEEFNLRNWEKLSRKRIFCGTEMLLSRKYSFVLGWSQADCYCRRSKKLSPSRKMLISFNWHCLLKISCKVSLKKKFFYAINFFLKFWHKRIKLSLNEKKNIFEKKNALKFWQPEKKSLQ